MAQEKKKKEQKPKTQALEIYVGQDKMALAIKVADQVKMLSTPTPQKYIMQRKGRGNLVLDYVETNYVIGLLNAIFKFDWDSEIIEQIVDKDEGQIAIKVRLTVRFADGKVVTKTAWGGADIKRLKETKKMMDFANDLKAAESDGIKKAASMLGVCWDVYSGLTPSGKKSKKFTNEKKSNGLTEPPGTPDRVNQFRTIPVKIGSKTYLHTKYEVLDRFKEAKKKLGGELYYEILGENGYEKSDQIPQEDIQKLYDAMVEAYKAMKLKPAETTEEKDVIVPPAEPVDDKLTNKLTPIEETATIKEEPIDEPLGFSAEEIEKEPEETKRPEFPVAEKEKKEEKSETPLQVEIMSLTSLESDLVDKGFTPDQVIDKLKEITGKDDNTKLTRKETQDAIKYFKNAIDQLNIAKEK